MRVLRISPLIVALMLVACVPQGDAGSNAPSSPAGANNAGNASAANGVNNAGAGKDGNGAPADDAAVMKISAPLTVAAGQTLTIPAGTTIKVTAKVAIQVLGTLELQGTAAQHVKIGGSGEASWTGIQVGATGKLTAAFADISDAATAIDGAEGSTISVADSTIKADIGYTLASGGSFARTRMDVTNSNNVGGGMLELTDVTISGGTEATGPDCATWSGGGAVIDHSRISGCHCATHIDEAPMGITITDSVMENADYPMMLTSTKVSIMHSNMLGAGGLLDLQTVPLSITAAIGGNYWGGMAPKISTDDLTQFTGTTDFATTPFTSAGPRP